MTAAPEIPADVMAAAREALAVEYERTEYGGVPYPTYADLARSGSGSFTLCSIRAIARAILAERRRSAAIADAMTVPLAAGRPNAEAHNAACRAISHAIQGPTT